jgi:serine/threonine-protein kinase RsbW
MLPVPDPFARADTLHLVVLAEPVSVRAALMRIVACPPVRNLAADHRATVELVLAEVLNNVAEHAYGPVPGPVAVTIQQSSAGLLCELVDDGVPMPEGVLPDGRLTAAPEIHPADLPEGGFGWQLIFSLAQDLVYRRDGQQNRLRLVIPHHQPDDGRSISS